VQHAFDGMDGGCYCAGGRGGVLSVEGFDGVVVKRYHALFALKKPRFDTLLLQNLTLLKSPGLKFKCTNEGRG
jgi:hypothetical protein